MQYLYKLFLLITKTRNHIVFTFYLQAMTSNRHDQPCDPCNNVGDVKMSSPVLGGSNKYYIIPRGATKVKYAL